MREHDPGNAGSVTVSEFIFLAFGLVLGVASGAALIEVIRARPPARREVRLTVAQDAIPRRRATTLADDAFVAVGPEPARGGPADRRAMEGTAPVGAADRRTNVLVDDHGSATDRPDQRRTDGRLVGMPITLGSDPMLGALRATATGTNRGPAAPSARPGNAVPGMAGGGAPERASVALLDPPAATGPGSTSADRLAKPAETGTCADQRRLADERCEVATRAQVLAAAAADALRQAQRAYDSHTMAATAAAAAGNPRTVRTSKESAQREFRAKSRAAASPEAVEAAARTWLQEINRINREARDALAAADRELEAATSTGAKLERLSLEADAARIGAEMADAACLAARVAVADCVEQSTATTSVARAATMPQADTVAAGSGVDEALGIALEGGGAPRIFRLLSGDQTVMETIVATLGGDDPDDRRHWELALAGLVDAIVADAIEAAALRFPHDHPFWQPYTLTQRRDITKALASLGHRFDGLGGWVDERVPSQRELSLAVGYAGLDPMRIRQWPTEAETAELFRYVEVAADEYVAGAAGDLTLAEMIDMLGRRADGLVELWNHWGRVRPLLLEDA